ncbi:MAG: hypothetical protein J6Y85_04800 [Alphaproteobacteria bacterium]|nr:hypothetical protein [Alphaproteobacteria bacterium]
MVEILGVLTIMGVLAITGITGFCSAMDKRHAKEIINKVNKRTYLGSADLLLNHNNTSLSNNFAVTSPTPAANQKTTTNQIVQMGECIA